MWGTFLSEPLRIVALVGRHPANQLMRRMPIPDRVASFTTTPCGAEAYGVLGHVSMGYPPVKGRLHTCYSPVRRSPAARCRAPLPLDLHVLSLSLAFILSQDQTLRCCYRLFSFFRKGFLFEIPPTAFDARQRSAVVPSPPDVSLLL